MSAFGIRKRRSSEQSPGSQNSPFDYRKKERLHRIPGRLYLNGSTEVASLFTQQGKKGTNQDAMIVWEGQNLVIANVGDSRAILGTRDNEDNSLTAVQLTVDLKPNLPVEAERIRKCKGRVFALREEPEVARVWLPKTNFPGLAMSRALGDFCLKSFGVISVPEVSYRRLTEKDEFIVLATDGIWDVLCNEEVVKIVASAPTRSSAAKRLVEAAVRGWRTKYPTSRTDDCAVVCLFLKAFSVGENEVNNEKVDASTTPAEMNGSDAIGNDENALGAESNKEQGKDWSSL